MRQRLERAVPLRVCRDTQGAGDRGKERAAGQVPRQSVGPRLSWNIKPGPPGTMSSRWDQSPASAMKPLSIAHPVSFHPLLLCSYPPPQPHTASPQQPPPSPGSRDANWDVHGWTDHPLRTVQGKPGAGVTSRVKRKVRTRDNIRSSSRMSEEQGQGQGEFRHEMKVRITQEVKVTG